MLVDIPEYFLVNNFSLVNVGSLFEIHTGVLDNGDAYYYEKENGQEINLKMFRMSSFDLHKRGLKPPPDLQKANVKLNELRKKREKIQESDLPNSKTKLDQEKELTKDDYVICTRSYGTKPFTGISLLNADLQSDHFIVSHHFLVLRPRKYSARDINITFLHLLMDAVLEDKAQKQQVSSDGKEGITKRKLEKMNVICPPLEWQDKFVDYHKSLNDNLITITETIRLLDGELSRHS